MSLYEVSCCICYSCKVTVTTINSCDSTVYCITLPKFSPIHLLVKVLPYKRRLTGGAVGGFLEEHSLYLTSSERNTLNNAYSESDGSVPGLSSVVGEGMKYFGSYLNNLA